MANQHQTQLDLANSLGLAGSTYVSHVVLGRKTPSAQWLDLVADTLRLSVAERRDLHVAGAKDHGFKIDLK